MSDLYLQDMPNTGMSQGDDGDNGGDKDTGTDKDDGEGDGSQE